MKTKPPGAPCMVCTPQNVERVRTAMLWSPRCSARRHAVELQISNRTVRRILHDKLRFHPYKLMLVQQMNETDYPQRLNFA